MRSRVSDFFQPILVSAAEKAMRDLTRTIAARISVGSDSMSVVVLRKYVEDTDTLMQAIRITLSKAVDVTVIAIVTTEVDIRTVVDMNRMA